MQAGSGAAGEAGEPLGEGQRLRRASLLVGALVTAAYAATLFVDIRSPVVDWADEIVPILVPLAAATLGFATSKRSSGRQRVVWSLFAAGCASWASGDIVFTVLDRTGRPPDSFSAADIGYIGLLACWLLAIAVHPHIGRRGLDLAASIVDASTILVVGATAVAHYVARPVVDARLANLDTIVLLAYPSGDLILLAAFVYLVARSWLRFTSPNVWFGVAIVLMLAADANYALLAASDAYTTGSPTDLLWIAAFVSVGFAASLRRPLTSGAPREGGDSHAVAVVGSIATAVLVALAVVYSEPFVLVLGLGAAVASALVVVRRAVFALENRRLMRTVRDHAQLSETAATAKEAFVAEASHQLRTPLTSIRVRLDVIKMTGLDDPMTPEYLEELSDEVDRLRRLAERLLTLASMEVVTPKQPRDIVKVVQESAARLAQRARLAQVDLRVVELPAQALVLSAPGALDEALMNLLDNALKFTPPGGATAIAVTSGEGLYEICVDDDGPGFDEEFADRLFEPFYRVASQKPGYGLGLAIVKRICDSENAEVSLERRLEGGTRALIRWPMMRTDAAATSEVGAGSS